MEYLVNGITNHDEGGLFVSFEQREEDLIEQAEQFGWSVSALQRRNMLHLLCISPSKIKSSVLNEIKKIVNKNNVKRLVIDSLSTLLACAPILDSFSKIALTDLVDDRTILSPPIIGQYVQNRFLYYFIDELRELRNCTSLLISEASDQTEVIGEYVCDGHVQFFFESSRGGSPLNILVKKMRKTNNDKSIHPFQIGKKGIEVEAIISRF